MNEISFYFSTKQDRDNYNPKIYREDINVQDSESKESIDEKVSGLKQKLEEQIINDKGKNDKLFMVFENFKYSKTFSGITLIIKGLWVGNEFINNNIEQNINRLNFELSKDIKDFSYLHCPRCGKELVRVSESELVCDNVSSNCNGTSFIYHGIKGIDTKAGDSWSITYLN